MRRLLEAGKFRTILSAILFMTACGIFVVHATSGGGGNGKFYTEYNTGAIGNTLTSDKWNSVMKDLDKIIPEGTVMAFLTDECPEGWDEFTGAEGRFLMGAHSGLGDWGGSNTLTKVPVHQHELMYKNREEVTDNHLTRGMVVDWDDDKLPSGVQTPNSSYWDTDTTTYSFKTSSEGSVTGVDITNEHINVRYCVKGNYGLNEDKCPAGGGYTPYLNSCGSNDWLKLVTTLSNFGTFTCGKCIYKTCEEYNSSWETCLLDPDQLDTRVKYHVQKSTYPGVCVKTGCCQTDISGNPNYNNCIKW